MIKSIASLGVAVMFCVLSVAASGQSTASTAPTTTRPRQQVVVPPGYRTVTVNGRRVICDPVDEGWVTTALTKIPASKRPATMPAAILDRLASQRDSIIRQMMADLAITDPAPLAHAYDLELTAGVRELDALRPSVFYLVTSLDKLGDLMRGGWTYPHYYYNRAADAVSFNEAGLLNTGGPSDDILFPAIFNPKESADQRAESLSLTITGREAAIAAAIDLRTRNVVGADFARIISNLAIVPLKLKDDQIWFGVGVADVLSAKYAAVILNEPRAQLIANMTYEHPANPLKMTAIDLLHPDDIKTMRQEALPAYFDTVRRKSARAVDVLVKKGGGDSAIAKSLTAIRKKMPADGSALVTSIKDATGVDLTPLLVH